MTASASRVIGHAPGVNRLRHRAGELGQPVLDDDEVWRHAGVTFEQEKSAVGADVVQSSKAPVTQEIGPAEQLLRTAGFQVVADASTGTATGRREEHVVVR
jgi:hypothetical protein